MEFNESKTKENIARAFAGLCQDGARYQFISKSAINEGFVFISDYLKKIAKHKMAHASILYQFMLEESGKAKEHVEINAGYPFENYILKTSLKDSSEIEGYEGENLYTYFSTIAKDEGFSEIAKKFEYMSEIYLNFSNDLFALANLFDNKKLYTSKNKIKWHCTNCGYNFKGTVAPKTCPLCSYPQGYYMIEIDEAKI